jgi:hypothetical protein
VHPSVPILTEIIVPESRITDVFYEIISAYERVLYLKGYDSDRIDEITMLQQQLILDRRSFAAKGAAAKPKIPKCPGLEAASNSFTSCCTVEDACHCPA